MTDSGTWVPPGASAKTLGRPSCRRASAGKRERTADRSGTTSMLTPPSLALTGCVAARRVGSRTRVRHRELVDRRGELEDLARQVDQLLVLTLLGLDDRPLVVREDLPFRVGAVLADHHECGEEDRLERHDQRQGRPRLLLEHEHPDRE